MMKFPELEKPEEANTRCDSKEKVWRGGWVMSVGEKKKKAKLGEAEL